MKKLLAILLFCPAMSYAQTNYEPHCSAYIGGNDITYMKFSYWLEGYYAGRNPGTAATKEPAEFAGEVYRLCEHLQDDQQDISILDAGKAVEIIGGVK